MVMRLSRDRWLTLSALLGACERLMEHNARLDAYHRDDVGHVPRDYGASVGQRLDAAVRSVTKELNRLTVERLAFDLARKKRLAVA